MTRDEARSKAEKIFVVKSGDSICAARKREADMFVYQIYLTRNNRETLSLGSGSTWEAAIETCKLVAQYKGRYL